MLLLKFCKQYIIAKYNFHQNSYAEVKEKHLVKEALSEAVSYKHMSEIILDSVDKKFYSIGNYLHIVEFCLYVVTEGYPYTHKSFDLEIFTDFMWIYSCNKKLSTRSYYIGLISSFVMDFNINIHEDSRIINITRFRNQYHTYLSMDERLTDEEIGKLFLALERNQNEKLQMMILMLLKTGIRVSEMLHLKKEDIFFQGGLYFFNIKGKGNMYRIVSMKKRDFKEFYSMYVNHLDLKEFIFQTRTKAQISRMYVYREIKKILRKLGIFKHQNGPHLFRHTFASKMYEKYRDIVLVQEYIGHTNVESTRRYIHLHERELQKTAHVYDDIVRETFSIIGAFLMQFISSSKQIFF